MTERLHRLFTPGDLEGLGDMGRKKLRDQVDEIIRQFKRVDTQLEESAFLSGPLRRIKSFQDTATPFLINPNPDVHPSGTVFDDVSAAGAATIKLPTQASLRPYYDLVTEIPHFWVANTSAQAITLSVGDTAVETLEIGATAGAITSLTIPRDNTALHFMLLDDRWRCLNPGALEVAVRAQRSSAQSITDATEVYVDWNTENYDSHAFHDNSTNPSRLTVPTGLGGVYTCMSGIQLAASAGAGTVLACVIRHFNSGGTLLNQGGHQAPSINSASVSQAIVSCYEGRFDPGDYIRVVVYQNHGAAVDLGPDAATRQTTFVSMHRVRG